MGKWQKNCCISPVLITLLCSVCVILFQFSIIEITDDPSFHFGIMTVNALFGGFLYSNYGLIVGLLDNETIKQVTGTDIIIKRNFHVLWGIIYATLSVLCGLYIVLIGSPTNQLTNFIYITVLNGEIVFMISAICLYLVSLIEMNQVITALHKPLSNASKQKVEEIRIQILSDDNSE